MDPECKKVDFGVNICHYIRDGLLYLDLPSERPEIAWWPTVNFGSAPRSDHDRDLHMPPLRAAYHVRQC